MNNLSFSGSAAVSLNSVPASAVAATVPLTSVSATSGNTPAVQVSLVSVAPSTNTTDASASSSIASANSANTKNTPEHPVAHAISTLNNYLQSVNLELNFTQDPQGTHFVQIIDTQSHQVIRQIPDHVAIALSEDISLQVMARAAGKIR